MNNNNGKKHASIWLDYFKQGDDFYQCKQENEDGSIDLKITTKVMVSKLEGVINHLKAINDKLPDSTSFNIYCENHYIGINGNDEIIDNLVKNQLINEEIPEESDETDVYNSSESDEPDVYNSSESDNQ